MITTRGVLLRVVVAGAVFCTLRVTAESQSNYVNQIMTQRVFYAGSKLHYDEHGHLVEPGSVCSWTVCAKIRITDVRVDGTMLRLSGERQFLILNETAAKDGIDVFSGAKRRFVSKKTEEELQAKRAVEIDVERSTTWDADAIDSAMRAIFLSPAEFLADVAPEYWSSFLCKQHVPSSRCAEDPLLRSTPRVGNGVRAPRAVSAPDPNYEESARLAAYQGTTILWLIVTPEGRASDIKIARPVGLGLDDKAVEAVSKWVFQPATRDGQPVPVQINVEVNFRLY